jgi:elongation factor 1-gamma
LHKFQILEDHLAQTGQEYLVGDSLTLSDLFVAGIAAGAFMFFLDAEWRREHRRCTEWFERVAGGEMMVAVGGKPVLVEKAIKSSAREDGRGAVMS